MMEDESPCGAVVAMAEEAPFVSMPPEGSNIFDLVTVLNANWGATAARHSLHRAIAHQVQSKPRTSPGAHFRTSLQTRFTELSAPSSRAEPLCAARRFGRNVTGTA